MTYPIFNSDDDDVDDDAYKGWLRDDTKQFKEVDAPLVDHLPAGYYGYDQPFIKAMDLAESNDIQLSEQQREIHGRIQTFWSSRDKYRAMGIPHRRGILLHGLPGTGKTTVIRVAARELIANNGIVVEMDANRITETPWALRQIKRIEGERPVMLVVEDLDHYSRDSFETWMTGFLDGVVGIDSFLLLSTTNYLDKISDRLQRQGRIDEKWEIPTPSTEQRAVYIQTLLEKIEGADEDFMARMVVETDSMVMSDIKGYVVNQVVFQRAHQAQVVGR